MSASEIRGQVTAVARDAAHRFSKSAVHAIELLAGLGVAGDAHAGVTVRHRSRVAADPTQPNLRQVHLIEEERFAVLVDAGFADIAPGAIGENVRTAGVALSALPVGARLIFDGGAEIALTGLRNPCRQLDAYRPGLMRALVGRNRNRALLLGGVMGVVVSGGSIARGDEFRVALPHGERRPLRRV